MRNLAYGALVEPAHRKQNAGKHFLGQSEEEIALILVPIDTPGEHHPPAPGIALHLGVVPGGQMIRPHAQSPPQEMVKLDPRVAFGAGRRCCRSLVGAHERLQHRFPEGRFHVQNVERHPQDAGGLPGRLGVITTTAATAADAGDRQALAGLAGSGLREKAHGDAEGRITLLLHHGGSG